MCFFSQLSVKGKNNGYEISGGAGSEVEFSRCQMAAGIFGKTWQSNPKKLGLDKSLTTILLLRYQGLVT